MSRLVFDLETNGLLPELTTIHCLCIRDADTGNVRSYYGETLEEGLDVLSGADEIIAHNGIRFDYEAIKKLYPDWTYRGKLTDTLVMSQLLYPERKFMDMGLNKRRERKRQKPFPKYMYGRHSLESWGHRFGLHKGDYSADMKAKGLDPWAEFNQDMLEYCEQDTAVTLKLWRVMQRAGYSQQAADLEHQCAWILAKQMAFGCYFNKQVAVDLTAMLSKERDALGVELTKMFGCWYARDKEVVPKRNNKTLGYVAGCPVTKIKEVEFNPGSRDHIANRLITVHGWNPPEYTETGKPKVDEKTLKGLDFPGVNKVRRFLLVDKRIGQVSEGKNGWLKLVKDDNRVYHWVNQNGTVTGRGTHSRPNLGQVPRVTSPFGRECRSCFRASPGWTFVGADAAGLELRCLAHYMAIFDGGAYAKVVTEGDVHTENQTAASLPSRDLAKTFIYGFLYGAGDGKIGEIVGGDSEAGAALRAKFLKGLPALAKLSNKVKQQARKNKHLKTLDGRKLAVRHQHAALNTLLQGAGAIIIKQAMAEYHRLAAERGLVHGVHFRQVLWVHDEFQCEALPEHADAVGQAMVDGIRNVTQILNLRCPLDGEYKTGAHWGETH